MKSINSVKGLPKSERPREKLKKYGVSFLTNEELLTILIGSGNKYNTARELSLKILSNIEEMSDLYDINYEKLASINGLGPSKVSIILAAIELSKRMGKTELIDVKITSSDKVFSYFKQLFYTEMQECFYALYLDSSKKVIKIKLLFKGTLDHSLVHPRELFKEAYLLSASSIICVHNHPSGNISPSKEDKMLTSNLVRIGLLHGIPVVDHIIIGKDKYYSFFENGEI